MSLDDDLAPAITDKERLTRLSQAFKDAGLDPADLGSVERVKFYEGFHKDDEGESHVVPMVSFQVNPAWATGPEWPAVQPAPRPQVKPASGKRTVVKGWHKALILPDMQIGCRRYVEGETVRYDWFHDERALDVAFQIMRWVRPDRVIFLGDNFDFPEFGKYEQEPEFQDTTQATIDKGGEVCDRTEANAPEASYEWLEGNHERRLPKAIAKNFMAAMRLRKANAPESWPVLTVPALLDFENRPRWSYVDGYPAASVTINDGLAVEHGKRVRSGGSTAAAVANDSTVSRIFGHVHREEYHSKTWDNPATGERRQVFAASPGCLCRVDGTVPGSGTATDGKGAAVPEWQNWQQGLAVVTFQEGNGRSVYERIGIEDGHAFYRDRWFEAAA